MHTTVIKLLSLFIVVTNYKVDQRTVTTTVSKYNFHYIEAKAIGTQSNFSRFTQELGDITYLTDEDTSLPGEEFLQSL